MVLGPAKSQSEIQEILETLLPNVYFDPPSGHQMQYPCIVYELDSADTTFADNGLYRYLKRYTVTVIDPDSDDTNADKVAALRHSKLSRAFLTANLHHHVFTTYF